MWGDRAYHTVLIAVLLLPGFVVSVDAQRSKAGRQEQRGVNVVPAVPAPHTAERHTALVIGNSSYAEGPLANPVNDATDMANFSNRWALPSHSSAMRLSGACALPLRSSAKSYVPEWSGSSILRGMGCRSKERITSCRSEHGLLEKFLNPVLFYPLIL